jgi:hypothetical protein
LKKYVGILVALVIGLGIGFIFGYFYENGEVTKEKEKDIKTATAVKDKSDSSNKTYQFKDIESMEKAKTVGEAIDRIFGDERLVKTEGNKDMFTEYYKEKLPTTGVLIPFFMKPGSDSRMEMIDFLHYIKFSGLMENAWGEGYHIQMNVFQPIKPGMNLPDPHQKWGIKIDKLKVMDFSDKETMLGEIHQYGEFEGVNPSGMN